MKQLQRFDNKTKLDLETNTKPMISLLKKQNAVIVTSWIKAITTKFQK